MTTDEIMRLIYLLLLGGVIAGSAIVAGRRNLGKMVQQAAIWVLIFIGVIAAYGLWEDVSNDVAPRQSFVDAGTVEVPQSTDGHYYLTLDVNGTPVDFVVDTGASQIVLSQQDATRIGLNPATLTYSGRASTANGVTRTAPVMLDAISLGPLEDRSIMAVVNAGAMDQSLLGMTYLGLYDRIAIENGRLVLSR